MKFVPDWFVKSKIPKKLHVALFANDDTLFLMKILLTFYANRMGILCVDVDKINLDNADFYEEDPETNIHIRHLAWRNKFEKCKVYKEDLSNELILETWLASNKMVGLVVARRWEKRNRTNFCWQSWCMIKWGGRGKNDFSVFQSSISFGGIRTLWDKKLCMKTRCNPKTFVNFIDFSCVNLWAQNVSIPSKSYTTTTYYLSCFLSMRVCITIYNMVKRD